MRLDVFRVAIDQPLTAYRRWWPLLAILFYTSALAAQADLELTTRFAAPTAATGRIEYLDVTLRNAGASQTATGVTVQTTVPAGLTVARAEYTQTGTYAAGQWTVPSLAAGQTVLLRLAVHPDAAGSYDVLSEVTAADQTDPDSTPGNNSANQTEDDESRARLAVDDCVPAAGRLQVVTDCNDNGTTDPTDDYYTLAVTAIGAGGTLEVLSADGYGSYTAVDGTPIVLTDQVPIGQTTDFFLDDGGTCYYFRQTSPASCSVIADCFAYGNNVDRLFRYDGTTGSWTDLGGTGGSQVQGIAYNPFSDTLYAGNSQDMGFINQSNGAYQTLHTPTNAFGPVGNVDIRDWHAATYDPYTGYLWLAMRRTGSSDLLMVWDPVEEQMVYDYFGLDNDYKVLAPLNVGGVILDNVEDLVYHPTERVLYAAIADDALTRARLVKYDPATGNRLETIGDFGGILDVAGLSLTSRGTLVATTGRDAVSGTNNRFYEVKLPSGETTLINAMEDGNTDTDPEAITCLTADPMTISGRVYNDTNRNDAPEGGETGQAGVDVALYVDVDGDGRVTSGVDHYLATTTTDASGNYSFETVIPADYVVVPTEGQFPNGGAPTYPATRTATASLVPAGSVTGIDFGIGQAVDLELTADWQYAGAEAGDVLELTLTLENAHSTLGATGVTVTDLLPDNLTLLGNNPSVGQYNAATQTWTVGAMPGGTTQTLVFTVRVEATGTYDYTAQVATQSGTDADSAPGNDTGYQLEDDETAARLSPPAAATTCTPADTLLLVDPACFNNNTAATDDDYYIMTAYVGGATGTDYALAYSGGGQTATQTVTAGNVYTLTLQIPIGERTGFVLTEIGGAGACYTHQITSPGGCSEDIKCFAVADSGDHLYEYSSLTDTWTAKGSLGASEVEGIAYDYIRDTLYTVNNQVFGWINQANGDFTALSTAIGFIDGPAGAYDVLSVDGLTYDHVADIFWASERTAGGTTDLDLLFQIDRKTGQPVYDAFGPGVDYLIAEAAIDPSNGNQLRDVDDIALDPATGELYGIANQGGSGDALVTYDKTTGSILRTVSAFTGVSDMEGLSFFNRNVLAATTGNSSTDPADDDRLFKISPYTGLTTQLNQIDPTLTHYDFEASDCLTGQPNEISGKFFLDSSEDGSYQGSETGDTDVLIDLYYDFDGDGKIDPAIDRLVQTDTTDGTGDYDFLVASTGSFLVQPRAATIPGGGREYTTDALYAADFYTMGNTAPNNDFGSVNGCVFDSAAVLDVTCNKGADPNSPDDDYMVITFIANATNATGNFTVGISSGSVTPATGIYGVPVTVQTEPGSAGKGNVVLTLSDATYTACTFDLYVEDPGDCPCPRICLPIGLTRVFE